jgi:hypothetical protein
MCETENSSVLKVAAGILAEVPASIETTDASSFLQTPAGERTRLRLVAGFLCWLCGVVASFTVFALYEATPNSAPLAVQYFPSASGIPRAAGKPTLLMFVHPRCACSRASLAELQRLLTQLNDKVEATLVLQSVSGEDPLAQTTDVVLKARALTGVAFRVDRDGKEAALFGATTSGHTLLYAEDGKLLFSGGLTNSRGHEGASLGSAHLMSALSASTSEAAPLARERATEQRSAPVFGCGLLEEGTP